MSEYVISRPAIRDLESISSYFVEVNVEAGERFLRGFNKRCQQLASFPKIGRSYDDVQSGLRGLASHHITQDLNRFRVPEDLPRLLNSFVGILG